VERVDFIKFLGIYITKDSAWSLNTSSLTKRAQQRLFLRKLKQAGLPHNYSQSFTGAQ